MKRLFLLFFVVFMAGSIFPQSLTIEISDIQNNHGVIRLAFFVNEEQFKHEITQLGRIYDKALVIDSKLVVKVDSLPYGIYGIALFDDENKNGKLDYRLMIPREGIGFSNLCKLGFKRPKFSDFSFDFNKNHKGPVQILMRYY